MLYICTTLWNMITWKYMPHFDLFSMLSGSFGTDIFFWSISSILLLARIHVLQCFTGSQVPAGVVVGLCMMQQLSFTSYMPLHTLQRRPEVARMPGFPLTQNWHRLAMLHTICWWSQGGCRGDRSPSQCLGAWDMKSSSWAPGAVQPGLSEWSQVEANRR